MALDYRNDIDGLRALAVVPVVLFHAQIAGFTGGFVGVDVFFVISGFLITALIQREVSEGRFSYVNFWERRARRLLPALIVVTAFTLLGGYFLLLPDEFKSLGQSVVASSVFLSNMFFWLKAGYFEAPAETVPLLHTWSLAVEEQFYILFPAVLTMLAGVAARVRIGVILLIGVVSFVISAWLVRSSPDSAYYLLPSRAWELMLGAFLSLWTYRPRLSGAAADALLALGLALVFAPIFIYSKNTPFPGEAALAPCLGTALIIWVGAQPGSRLIQLFTNRPTVYVGQMSYSLYLWHWPMLVLGAAYLNKHIAELTGSEKIVLIALSFIGAWVSLQLVENPIRKRKFMATRPAILGGVGGALAVLATAGLAVHLAQGAQWRVPDHVIQIASATYDGQRLCANPLLNVAHVEDRDLCELGNVVSDSEQRKVILWGDSHASALIDPVQESVKAHQAKGWVLTKGGCPPLLGLQMVPPSYADCAQFNDAVAQLIADEQIDAAVLAGYWGLYRKDMETRWVGTENTPADDSQQARLELAFRNTLQYLNGLGVEIILVDEVPQPVGRFSPTKFAVATWRGSDEVEGERLDQYIERTEWYEQMLDQFQVAFVRVAHTPTFCAEADFCPAVEDGRSNYRDAHHLTATAALRLTPAFNNAFSDLGWTQPTEIAARHPQQ